MNDNTPGSPQVTVSAGERLDLLVEKPAAGGRMIARHQGLVVLVHGAIPGERVLARIERADRNLAFASVERVLEPSAGEGITATGASSGMRPRRVNASRTTSALSSS